MRATFHTLMTDLDVATFVRNRHDHAVSVVRWALILCLLYTSDAADE